MAELNLNADAREESKLLRLTTDLAVTHDVSEEFSLPDYVPEIRRLLNVRAQVLPESKYIGDKGADSSLEFGGTVTYLLIYTDDEGELCSLPLTSSYEAETSLTSHPGLVFIDTTVDNVTSRVNAPRKVTLKSRLKSRIQGWEQTVEEEKIQGKSTADELFIERKTETLKAVSIKAISLQGIKLSDKLDMMGNQGPRPIWCDAAITINDAKAQNNTVSVRGETIIKCICQSNGEMITLTKTVPLAEEIEADGATLGDIARVSPRCISLAISNEENEGVGQLFFDLDCELEGELIRNTDCVITKDCYSTKYETEESYKTIEVYTALKAQNSSFMINESAKRKSKDIESIIDVICDPVYEKTEYKGGKAIVCGKLGVTIIGKSEKGENEKGEYLSEGYEIPFKYACDLGKSIDEGLVKCDLSVGTVNARYEGDKLYVGAQIYTALSLMEKNTSKALDTAALKKDREFKKEAGCVRVYFPREGDTLWEIAKKYHTTMNTIKENNDLTSESMDGVKNLII